MSGEQRTREWELALLFGVGRGLKHTGLVNNETWGALALLFGVGRGLKQLQREDVGGLERSPSSSEWGAG